MQKSNLEALQLSCRFSLPPNSLGYCGKNSAIERSKSCVINGDCNNIEEEIKNFIVLHPYLKTISKILDKPLTNYEVVESYWLGNNTLKKATLTDYDLLIKNFAKQGVPDWLVEELKIQKPKQFIPFHLFQVLHVGVGRASGSVPFNLESSNNCMVRWGQVIDLKNNTARVLLNSLEKNEGLYSLKLIEETHGFIPEFLPNLKIGDIVTVHWKQVVKILNVREVKNITFWTKEVLEAVN